MGMTIPELIKEFKRLKTAATATCFMHTYAAEAACTCLTLDQSREDYDHFLRAHVSELIYEIELLRLLKR